MAADRLAAEASQPPAGSVQAASATLPAAAPSPSAIPPGPRPKIDMPESLRQGDPCVARLLVPEGLTPAVRLLLPGTPLPRALTPLPRGTQDGLAVWQAVFAVPLETPPDMGSLVVSLPPAAPASQEAGRAFQVVKRSLRVEEIVLTPAMETIKTASDPVRDEQARRYAALLASAHPDAVFLDGSFQRPVASDRYTAFFGDSRTYRYPNGAQETGYHWGIDFGVPSGTPVRAPARGRVALAENRISTGWTVVLEHLPGMYTIYMHMGKLAVAAGDLVEARQLLGSSGATGFATGPHLHWEMRIDNVAVDPEALVPAPPGSRRFMP